VWGSADNFSLAEPQFFHMMSMGWTRPTMDENQYVGLKLKSVNGYAFHAPLVAWTKDANGFQSPAPMASLGIPDTPDLSSDSTVVAWFARRWPASLPAGQPLRVRIATADATASTGWLTVYPNAISRPGSTGPAGTAPDLPANPDAPDVSPNPPGVPEDSLAHGVPGVEQTRLRVILGSPLGGAPAVVLVLPAPAAARVELFDVQGRKLVTLADHDFAAGTHVVAWDGRDQGGARAPRGLYFVRLTTPASVRSSRFFFDP
jgi:hypothetical protein